MIIDAFAHGLHGGYFQELTDIGGEWVMKIIESEQKRASGRPQMQDVKLRLVQLEQNRIDREEIRPTD